jgi:hypothetical protein
LEASPRCTQVHVFAVISSDNTVTCIRTCHFPRPAFFDRAFNVLAEFPRLAEAEAALKSEAKKVAKAKVLCTHSGLNSLPVLIPLNVD